MIAGFTQPCCRTQGPFCTALSGMHAGQLSIALEALAALFVRVITFLVMLCKQQGWQRHVQQAVGQAVKHCMSTFSQDRACQCQCIRVDWPLLLRGANAAEGMLLLHIRLLFFKVACRSVYGFDIVL